MDSLSGFSIPVTGLSTGNHGFEFHIDRQFFDAFEGSPVDDGNAVVNVEAQKTAAGLTLLFRIEGEAVVPCDRCLEPLTLPVSYEGCLAVRAADADEQGEYDGEVIWIGPRDAEVNVAQYIYESICLSLPVARVHGTDAESNPLCDQDMLARFQIVSQREFDEMTEAKNEENQLSEELKKIKYK